MTSRCGRSGRRRSPHPQVLSDTGNSTLDEPHMRWSGPEFGIGNQLGLDELHNLTATFQRTRAGGDDVLHPLHVRPVGQEEIEKLTSTEHIDRRAIGAPGLTPWVHQDAE